MALNLQQKALRDRGWQELTGLRLLTRFKLLGAIIGLAIGFFFLGLIIYLILTVQMDLIPALMFLFIPGIFLAVFGFQYYLYKSLRDFKMWAYEWLAVEQAISAVSNTGRAIGAAMRGDVGKVFVHSATAAIRGGLLAYLLKPEVKSKYAQFSNAIYGYQTSPGGQTTTLPLQANYRVQSNARPINISLASSIEHKFFYGAAWAVAVIVLTAQIIFNKPDASIQTFIGYGAFTLVFASLIPLLSSAKGFVRYSHLLLTVVIGFSGLLAYVMYHNYYATLDLNAFVIFFTALLGGIQVMAYLILRSR